MRKYLTVSAIVLALHLAATLWITIYRSFLIALGGRLIHATDIAALPDLLFAGFLLFGALLLLVAIAVAYAMRRTSRRLTSA